MTPALALALRAAIIKFVQRLTSPAIDEKDGPVVSSDGVFRIELTESMALWQHGLAGLGIDPTKTDDKTQEELRAIVRRQEEITRKWFGKKNENLLLPIKVHVQCVDQNGANAYLTHYLMLQTSLDRVRDVIASWNVEDERGDHSQSLPAGVSDQSAPAESSPVQGAPTSASSKTR